MDDGEEVEGSIALWIENPLREGAESLPPHFNAILIEVTMHRVIETVRRTGTTRRRLKSTGHSQINAQEIGKSRRKAVAAFVASQPTPPPTEAL